MIERETSTSGPDGALETEESADCIASNKVEGTAVYGLDRHKIGHVHNFMVNKRSGQVEHVIISDGGFFGLGGDHFLPIHWQHLKYDERLGGYVTSVTKALMQEKGRMSAEDADMQIW